MSAQTEVGNTKWEQAIGRDMAKDKQLGQTGYLWHKTKAALVGVDSKSERIICREQNVKILYKLYIRIAIFHP